MRNDKNTVTLTGRLGEQPSMSETQQARPIARFHVLVVHEQQAKDGSKTTQELQIPCYAIGHPANSLHKYWQLDLELVVTGTLDIWRYPRPEGGHEEAMLVKVETIGFVSPRKACEGVTA